ncbi:uncharacterized protein [Acropora muricata]|uniref:uncharacterized protein n=1 Tax=Acropora muricata TaxID=159855 RepID=UPI0034E4E438
MSSLSEQDALCLDDSSQFVKTLTETWSSTITSRNQILLSGLERKMSSDSIDSGLSSPSSQDTPSLDDRSYFSNTLAGTLRSAIAGPRSSTSSPGPSPLVRINGPISRTVSSAFARVFSRRAAILNIVKEKALGTRLPRSFDGLARRVSLDSVDSGISPTSMESASNLDNVFDDLVECFSQEINPAGQSLKVTQEGPCSKKMSPWAPLEGLTQRTARNSIIFPHPVATNQACRAWGNYQDSFPTLDDPLQALHSGLAQGLSKPSRLLVTAVRRLCNLLSEPRTHHLDCVYARILNNSLKEMEEAACRGQVKRSQEKPKVDFDAAVIKRKVEAYDPKSGPRIKRDLSYGTKRLLSHGCHPVQLKRVECAKGIDDFQKHVKQKEQDKYMTVNESSSISKTL